jgi:hypothetical protein
LHGAAAPGRLRSVFNYLIPSHPATAMPPKGNQRPADGNFPIKPAKHLLLRAVTSQTAAAGAARRLAAMKPAASAANHARHHVSRAAQS